MPMFRRSCSCPRFALGLGAVYLEPSILQIVHVCILWHLFHLYRRRPLQTRARSTANRGQQCRLYALDRHTDLKPRIESMRLT